MRTLLAVACLIPTLGAPPRAAQFTLGPVNPGSSAIGGRVSDARTGAALAGVTVRMFESRTSRSAETTTDQDGRYEFAGIADGEFTIVASSDTHGRACHGATDLYQVRCVAVAVVRDQQLSGIDFQMPESAAISGIVVDHDGRGVARARVMTMFGPLPGNRSVTGPDGRFQLTNVMPGENRVVVEPTAAPGEPEPPTAAYPDHGQFLPIKPGERVSGVTITVTRLALSEVSARVSSAVPGVDGMVVMIASARPRMTRRMPFSADGIASTRGLREGRYYVYARGQAPDGTVASFEVLDLVEGSHEVSLPLQPTGRVTGRVVAERGGLPPLNGVSVEAVWTDDGLMIEPLARDEATVGPDGVFRVDHLFGTRTLQVIGLSQEWRVQSVQLGGRDVAASGVDIAPGAVVDVTIVVAQR